MGINNLGNCIARGLAPLFRGLSDRRFRRAMYWGLAVRRSGTEEGSLGLRRDRWD
jgi:hypothetical protein